MAHVRSALDAWDDLCCDPAQWAAPGTQVLLLAVSDDSSSEAGHVVGGSALGRTCGSGMASGQTGESGMASGHPCLLPEDSSDSDPSPLRLADEQTQTMAEHADLLPRAHPLPWQC